MTEGSDKPTAGAASAAATPPPPGSTVPLDPEELQATAERYTAFFNTEFQAAAERYAAFFYTVPVALLVCETIRNADGAPDLVVLDANPEFEQEFRWSRREILGRRVRELNTDTDEFWIELLHEAAQSGHSIRYEHYSRRIDRYLEGTAFRIRPGVAGLTASDVTQRRQLAEELRKLHWQQELILANAGEGIFGLDHDGRISFINPVAVDALAYGDESLVGRLACDLWHDHGPLAPPAANAECPFAATLRDGSVRRGSTDRFRRQDGSLLTVDYACTPILDAGKIAGAVVLFRDISSRQRHDEERRHLEERLRQAQKIESLGILAGGIAHDFNNLLMVIIGNAELLLSDLAENSPLRLSTQGILKASQRAAELSRSMLTYAGRSSVTIHPLDLNNLLRNMGNLLAVSIPSRIAIEYDCAADLPEIHADESQLHQMVLNLVTNAAEAIGTQAGTIHLKTGIVRLQRVDFRASYLDDNQAEGAYALLEIRDDGCGMSADVQGRMFDPFFTTKFTGRGLGLATVLGIVRSHAGTIQVKSEPGRGTRVRVFLPCPVTARRTPVAVVAPVAAPVVPVTQAPVIMVVDDEEGIRQVVQAYLQKHGYKVLLAVDGVEALEVMQQNPGQIQAVILDLNMPRMGGEDTFTALRQIRPDLPVILCSGYEEEDAVRSFGGLGLSGFLHKPYETRALLARLDKLVRH